MPTRIITTAIAIAVLLGIFAGEFSRGEDAVKYRGDDLKYRLLSHLQEVAEEGEPLLPIPKTSKPRRLTTSDETLPYSGPPAEIDGLEILPLTPGVTLDPHVYEADSPIGMEHPLLSDPVMRDGMARLSSHRNGFFQKLSLTAT